MGVEEYASSELSSWTERDMAPSYNTGVLEALISTDQRFQDGYLSHFR